MILNRYKINWEARGIYGDDTVEAESADEAKEIAYQMAKDDFESCVDVDAELTSDIEDDE